MAALRQDSFGVFRSHCGLVRRVGHSCEDSPNSPRYTDDLESLGDALLFNISAWPQFIFEFAYTSFRADVWPVGIFWLGYID